MKKLNKEILRLAVPNIISNLSVPILSSVDTAVVGHLDKIEYLGAIAIGSMIFNFVYWGFGFLRMGTTGLTAQAFGKNNDHDVITNLGRSLTGAVISAIVLIAGQELIAYTAFSLVNASTEVEMLAREYFYIRIYAAPATLALYAFHGWFLGIQNAKYPLILSVTVNILNIIFNLLFIYQFGMKSDGVALGTVCAQYIGLITAVILYLKKYSEYSSKFVLRNVFDFEPLKEFVRVNRDIFIRTLALIFSFSYFTAVSAELGDDILAANTILLQLWMILSYGVDGFAFAAESLTGKFIGAKDKSKLKEMIKLIFFWGLSLGVVLSIIYSFFGREIIGIYTDKEALINLAMSYFIWTIIAPVVNSICYIWDGIFIGATATKPMRNTMVLSTLLIFLPVILFTQNIFGNHALWIAMISFMIARGITLSFYAKKCVLEKAS
ncbi:MAG: MATE family efflux transporter [Melioribacteraceae bacterium]|nr:MATE family efflux transporter [Melioribacteraceae bacterium]MCF8356527.1 MATE family efflux transporter [Melioribacteraceae bacterium]MCF8395916.1 MATE family efflux transporter [Melioribacteraceae bacterium]MCF8420976.1 MATE family efflux transporter [Melioribacteraceae bacterium]